jgi:hypothetical protein
MEGLSNRQTGTFIKIVNGSFAVALREPTDKTVTRENKDGKTVHELIFDTLEGYIDDVVFLYKDKDDKPLKFGPQLKIHFLTKANGERRILDIPMKSVFAKRFLLSFPNFDLEKIVIINVQASSFKNEGNKIIVTTSVFFSQAGETGKLRPISQRWKQDNWEGITAPKMVDDGEGGRIKSYYYTMLDALEIAKKMLSEKKPIVEQPAEIQPEENDDLPF